MEVGVSLAPSKQVPVESVIELAKLAESLGHHSVWVPETWGVDAVSLLAVLARKTERIALAAGVLNVYSRSAALIAQTAATLQTLSNGRFILGLGTSGPIVVQDWHGVKYRSPIQRTRDYVEVIRLALSGKKVEYQSDLVKLQGFKLQNPPDEEVPIYIAALGEKNLRLTGELADGWLPIFAPRGRMQPLFAGLENGARLAGRRVEDLRVVAYVPGVVGDRAERLLKQQIAYYLGGMGTFYAEFFRRVGFTAETDEIVEKWRSGDRVGAAEVVPEELLEVFTLGADETVARERIEEYGQQGVDVVVVVPPRGCSAVEIAETLEGIIPSSSRRGGSSV
jgi:coenzyme F420-dependent oxidoreductase